MRMIRMILSGMTPHIATEIGMLIFTLPIIKMQRENILPMCMPTIPPETVNYVHTQNLT